MSALPNRNLTRCFPVSLKTIWQPSLTFKNSHLNKVEFALSQHTRSTENTCFIYSIDYKRPNLHGKFQKSQKSLSCNLLVQSMGYLAYVVAKNINNIINRISSFTFSSRYRNLILKIILRSSGMVGYERANPQHCQADIRANRSVDSCP